MNMNRTKFVVAGGGTAGWIAALYLKNYFPENSITVIESSEVGILGAGEGTTPHFIDFLRDVGINQNDFIKNTKATFKSGIKFTNWHGDGNYYFHPFYDGDSYSYIDKQNEIFAIDYIANGKNTKEICVSNLCAEQNKIKFHYENKLFKILGSCALHFDARLTAQYLKQISIERGIFHIDSKIISSVHDEQNFHIKALVLEDNKTVECDFVFDCTGFSRKIIGGVFKEEWIDYKKSLPVDRALPFFIENKTNVVPPYTEAIAMKYGWIWKIPVQGRYGCGYVFDSSYITDDEAKKEVIDLFGEVEFPRSFSFKAGFHKNIWVKNCICLGLSAGFIEPLEATSIWTTIRSLNILLDKFNEVIFTKNEEEIKAYNKKMRDFNEQVKDFIQLHYITNRNDSPFWKEYRTKNLISQTINDLSKIESYDEYERLTQEKFGAFDKYSVFAGVNFCNTQLFKNKFDTLLNSCGYDYENKFHEFENRINIFSDFEAIDHYKFLEHINNIK